MSLANQAEWTNQLDQLSQFWVKSTWPTNPSKFMHSSNQSEWIYTVGQPIRVNPCIQPINPSELIRITFSIINKRLPRTVCHGRPCTRRTLVAESPSALLYSSVLLCMALLLQIAVLMVFIWLFPSVKCTLTCLARITGKVAASPQDSFFPLVVLYSWRLKCQKIENVCEGWA